MKTPGPLALILTIGSLAGALTTINVFWGDWGWVTGKHYRVDHSEGAELAVIQKALDDIKIQVGFVAKDVAQVGKKVEIFETRWDCDELDEGLPGLRRWVDRVTPEEGEPKTDEYYRAHQRLVAAEDRFDDLDCSEVLDK